MFSWKSLMILCSIGDCLPSEGSKRSSCFFIVQLLHDEHSVVTVLEYSLKYYSTQYFIYLYPPSRY